MKQYLWTLDGGRLQCQSSSQDSKFNWIFLPGGPGLGSESLSGLTALLKDKIPGTFWHLDLPSDGSNKLDDKPISNWRLALAQAVTAFENVILVAHSTPGMYVQTMPELENILKGLVLIGSAPEASWQKKFAAYCDQHSNAAIVAAEAAYREHQDDDSLQKLLIAAAKYCFVTDGSLDEGIKLFKNISVNHAAHVLAAKSFDSEKYQATWVPQKVKALMMTGEFDHITPLNLYQNNAFYDRKNILLNVIKGAGHYPWFENPSDVVKTFQEYIKQFTH